MLNSLKDFTVNFLGPHIQYLTTDYLYSLGVCGISLAMRKFLSR